MVRSAVVLNGMQAVQTKRKSETVSFRIDSDIYSALQDESRKAGVNLNTLAGQIFNAYVSWGRYAHKLSFLPTGKDLLRELFQTVDKDTLERIAKHLGGTRAREEILFLFHRISPVAVLRFIELWGSHFDAFEHHYDGKKHFFTILHDINLNFSVFTKQYVSSMIESTLARIIQSETTTPNSISFSFEI